MLLKNVEKFELQEEGGLHCLFHSAYPINIVVDLYW